MTGFSNNLGPKHLDEDPFDLQNPCFARPTVEPRWHVTLAEEQGERIFEITASALCLAAFFGYLLYIRPEIDREHWTQYFFWFMLVLSLTISGLGIQRLCGSQSKNKN